MTSDSRPTPPNPGTTSLDEPPLPAQPLPGAPPGILPQVAHDEQETSSRADNTPESNSKQLSDDGSVHSDTMTAIGPQQLNTSGERSMNSEHEQSLPPTSELRVQATIKTPISVSTRSEVGSAVTSPTPNPESSSPTDMTRHDAHGSIPRLTVHRGTRILAAVLKPTGTGPQPIISRSSSPSGTERPRKRDRFAQFRLRIRSPIQHRPAEDNVPLHPRTDKKTHENDVDFNELLIDYMPKSKEETHKVLVLLSTTIMRAAYTLVSFIPNLHFQDLSEADFSNTLEKRGEYIDIWNGHNGSRVTKEYVLAAIVSDYVWHKIEDYSIFTPEAAEDLKKIAKMGYPSTEEEERAEQKCATNMEFKHGVSQMLSGASKDTQKTVSCAMEILGTALSHGLETNEKNQIAEIISDMGSQVWKAAINLRNQKGAIIHSFSTAEAVRILKSLNDGARVGTGVGGQPEWNNLAEFNGRFCWFPHVIIHRPVHTYDRGIVGRMSIDHYDPECAPVDIYPPRMDENTARSPNAQIRPKSSIAESAGSKEVYVSNERRRDSDPQSLKDRDERRRNSDPQGLKDREERHRDRELIGHSSPPGIGPPGPT